MTLPTTITFLLLVLLLGLTARLAATELTAKTTAPAPQGLLAVARRAETTLAATATTLPKAAPTVAGEATAAPPPDDDGSASSANDATANATADVIATAGPRAAHATTLTAAQEGTALETTTATVRATKGEQRTSFAFIFFPPSCLSLHFYIYTYVCVSVPS